MVKELVCGKVSVSCRSTQDTGVVLWLSYHAGLRISSTKNNIIVEISIAPSFHKDPLEIGTYLSRI